MKKYPFKSFPHAPVGICGRHEISRLEFCGLTPDCVFEIVKNVQIKRRGKNLGAQKTKSKRSQASVLFVPHNAIFLSRIWKNRSSRTNNMPTKQIFRRCSMSVELPHTMHSTAAPSAFDDSVDFKDLQQTQGSQGTVLKDWMLTSLHLKVGSSHNGNAMPPPSSPLKATLTADPAKVVSPREQQISPSHEAKSLPPPVAEIRIPIPETIASNSDDDDFETLYLCSRRDLHVVRKENEALAEENRLLKRHMIQLQKQLYSLRRTSQKRNVSWSIPSPKRTRSCNPQSSEDEQPF